MTWQVKDFADGWIDVADEGAARQLSAEQSGAAIRPKPHRRPVMTDLVTRLRALADDYIGKVDRAACIGTEAADAIEAAARERDAMREEIEVLAVFLDNVVIAQSLSKELRQAAHDEARAYLYTRRQALNQEQPA